MKLESIQREFFELLRQPLSAAERSRVPASRAAALLKPNDRMSALERLEVYHRSYWFRLRASLAEDFQGLRAILGQRSFDRLLIAYLNERPSNSFTLRDLGARLEAWLREQSDTDPLALDMARLEWAEIEAFDAAELPPLKLEDLARLGGDPTLRLQPHLRLLDLGHPVDELLLRIRERPVSRRIRRRPEAEPTFLAVHRQDEEVYFKRLEPAAYALLHAIQRGLPLSEAIGEGTDPAWLQASFAHWASLGWFGA